MSNYQYVVNAPERWDNIAAKAYGDPGMFETIIAVNSDVPIGAIVPAGTVLNIPIITSDIQATADSLLPPWA
jgi:hypothetical protein